jgi:hypothetical protein
MAFSGFIKSQRKATRVRGTKKQGGRKTEKQRRQTHTENQKTERTNRGIKKKKKQKTEEERTKTNRKSQKTGTNKDRS